MPISASTGASSSHRAELSRDRIVAADAPLRQRADRQLAAESEEYPRFATLTGVPGAVAQSGSAPRSHRGGQGFKSPQLHLVGSMSILVNDRLGAILANRLRLADG